MQLATRRVHTGRVLNLDIDTVRFPDGSEAELEIIRHPGAAAVVPLASPRGSVDPVVLLLRQYRYAAGGEVWEARRREALRKSGKQRFTIVKDGTDFSVHQ